MDKYLHIPYLIKEEHTQGGALQITIPFSNLKGGKKDIIGENI